MLLFASYTIRPHKQENCSIPMFQVVKNAVYSSRNNCHPTKKNLFAHFFFIYLYLQATASSPELELEKSRTSWCQAAAVLPSQTLG